MEPVRKENNQSGHPRWVLRKVLQDDGGKNFIGFQPLRDIGRQLLIPKLPSFHLGMCQMIIDAIHTAQNDGKCTGKEWKDILRRVENSLRLNILVNKGIVNYDNVKDFNFQNLYSKESEVNDNNKRKFDAMNDNISLVDKNQSSKSKPKTHDSNRYNGNNSTKSSPKKAKADCERVVDEGVIMVKLLNEDNPNYFTNLTTEGAAKSERTSPMKGVHTVENFTFSSETIHELVESKLTPELPAIPICVRKLLKEHDLDSPLAELYPEYCGEEFPHLKSKPEHANKSVVIQDADGDDYEGAPFEISKTISGHMEILN